MSGEYKQEAVALLLDTAFERLDENVLFPYAWDEEIGKRLTDGAAVHYHVWRHPRAFVLGLRDRRLPQAEQAMEALRMEGYQTAVRNSGGAAVPLDMGVVNISIVLPISKGSDHFRDDFAIMVRLISEALAPWTDHIDTGEIAGSYCPGDFDVSIGGKKFCGIAQRRLMNAIIIQAFINVEGSGFERGELVRRFYDTAASGAGENEPFPVVEAERMGTLQELAGVPGADAFVSSLKDVLLRKRQAVEPDKQSWPVEAIRIAMAKLEARYK